MTALESNLMVELENYTQELQEHLIKHLLAKSLSVLIGMGLLINLSMPAFSPASASGPCACADNPMICC